MLFFTLSVFRRFYETQNKQKHLHALNEPFKNNHFSCEFQLVFLNLISFFYVIRNVYHINCIV